MSYIKATIAFFLTMYLLGNRIGVVSVLVALVVAMVVWGMSEYPEKDPKVMIYLVRLKKERDDDELDR